MTTPWIKAVQLPTSDAALTALLRVPPIVDSSIHDLSPSVASGQLKTAIKHTFAPSEQDLRLIRRFADLALCHAMAHYASIDQFMSGIRSSHSAAAEPHLVMLTGHSGVGKSTLLKAFGRLIAKGNTVIPSKALPPFNINPVARLEIAGAVSQAQLMSNMLAPLGLQEEFKRGGAADINLTRLRLYQQGVCLIAPDEFQYLTKSDANARVVDVLMRLSSFGPPVLYSCNFSLGHKLKRRPPEDCRRLLASPIIMMPDLASDPVLIQHLQDIAEIFDGVLSIDPARDAEEINAMTFGLKGFTEILIRRAYVRARLDAGKSSRLPKVTMDHIRNAYLSPDDESGGYEAERRMVESCQSAMQGFAGANLDYVCPFELPAPEKKKQADQANEIRQNTLNRIMEKERQASAQRMRALEKVPYEESERTEVRKTSKPKPKPKPPQKSMKPSNANEAIAQMQAALR